MRQTTDNEGKNSAIYQSRPAALHLLLLVTFHRFHVRQNRESFCRHSRPEETVKTGVTKEHSPHIDVAE